MVPQSLTGVKGTYLLAEKNLRSGQKKKRNAYGTPLKARHCAAKGINLWNIHKAPKRWALSLLFPGGKPKPRKVMQLANRITQVMYLEEMGLTGRSLHHESTYFLKT